MLFLCLKVNSDRIITLVEINKHIILTNVFSRLDSGHKLPTLREKKNGNSYVISQLYQIILFGDIMSFQDDSTAKIFYIDPPVLLSVIRIRRIGLVCLEIKKRKFTSSSKLYKGKRECRYILLAQSMNQFTCSYYLFSSLEEMSR